MDRCPKNSKYCKLRHSISDSLPDIVAEIVDRYSIGSKEISTNATVQMFREIMKIIALQYVKELMSDENWNPFQINVEDLAAFPNYILQVTSLLLNRLGTKCVDRIPVLQQIMYLYTLSNQESVKNIDIFLPNTIKPRPSGEKHRTYNNPPEEDDGYDTPSDDEAGDFTPHVFDIEDDEKDTCRFNSASIFSANVSKCTGSCINENENCSYFNDDRICRCVSSVQQEITDELREDEEILKKDLVAIVPCEAPEDVTTKLNQSQESAANIDDEIKCSICLRIFLESDDPDYKQKIEQDQDYFIDRVYVDDHHILCQQDARMWIQGHNTCPICRRNITDERRRNIESSPGDAENIEPPFDNVPNFLRNRFERFIRNRHIITNELLRPSLRAQDSIYHTQTETNVRKSIAMTKRLLFLIFWGLIVYYFDLLSTPEWLTGYNLSPAQSRSRQIAIEKLIALCLKFVTDD